MAILAVAPPSGVTANVSTVVSTQEPKRVEQGSRRLVNFYFDEVCSFFLLPCQAQNMLQTCAKSANSDHPYHPNLCIQFIHSVVSNDSVSGQWMPWPDCAVVREGLAVAVRHIHFNSTLNRHLHYENMPIQIYIEKKRKNSDKKNLIFFIFPLKT